MKRRVVAKRQQNTGDQQLDFEGQSLGKGQETVLT